MYIDIDIYIYNIYIYTFKSIYIYTQHHTMYIYLVWVVYKYMLIKEVTSPWKQRQRAIRPGNIRLFHSKLLQNRPTCCCQLLVPWVGSRAKNWSWGTAKKIWDNINLILKVDGKFKKIRFSWYLMIP